MAPPQLKNIVVAFLLLCLWVQCGFAKVGAQQDVSTWAARVERSAAGRKRVREETTTADADGIDAIVGDQQQAHMPLEWLKDDKKRELAIKGLKFLFEMSQQSENWRWLSVVIEVALELYRPALAIYQVNAKRRALLAADELFKLTKVATKGKANEKRVEQKFKQFDENIKQFMKDKPQPVRELFDWCREFALNGSNFDENMDRLVNILYPIYEHIYPGLAAQWMLIELKELWAGIRKKIDIPMGKMGKRGKILVEKMRTATEVLMEMPEDSQLAGQLFI